MTSNSLKAVYNQAISANREQYRQVICNSHFVNTDGSNNSERIKYAAKQEAQKLIDELQSETLAKLLSRMNKLRCDDKLEELAALLCMHFFIIQERPPKSFLIRTAHGEVFREYCTHLYEFLTQSQK